MGNQGKILRKQGSKMYVFFSYFRSEFHFRQDTFTVSEKTPFLYLLAFLNRLN